MDLLGLEDPTTRFHVTVDLNPWHPTESEPYQILVAVTVYL
jgi:hypothetical protein